MTPPSFALTVFQLVPQSEQPPLATETLNDLNRALFTRISSRDDILLTQTEVNGIYCIRLAVGAQGTEERHILNAFHAIHQEAEIVLEEWNDEKGVNCNSSV